MRNNDFTAWQTSVTENAAYEAKSAMRFTTK